MSRPATTPGADRLLHCSPDRTLYVTANGAGLVVHKLFVRGSLDQAEREAELGRQLAHLGVVGYREARIDPITNRPCLVLDWHEGVDLDRYVAQHGAIPAARAANLLIPVARTLAAMQALATPQAPLGICHGDIKPGNLLVTKSTTLVLDLEHARAIAGGDTGATTIVGTIGFAAPEARRGSPASAALDIYGLGATLRWLLTGGGLSALPQDAELVDLVDACTDDAPQQRPDAATVAQTLAGIARRLANDSDEAILQRLTSGERLEFVSDSPRHVALQRWSARQRRLLARFPQLLTVPQLPPTNPTGLHLALHHTQRVLRHFPRHRPSLEWRGRLAGSVRELLANAASTVSERERAEQHDEAAQWLDGSVRLTRALLQLPGRQPIPGAPDPHTTGLLQRDPIAFLERLQQELAEATAELDAAKAAINVAEQQLDLVAAKAAIDAMAQRYGGSSPTATRRRDQLNRLAFYLARIAGAQANVERLGQTWNKTALEPLARFVADCTSAARGLSREDTTTPLGLRTLQVTLVNLAEEFPHLYVRSGPALEALSGALEHTSELAWDLVTEARKQLDAVPVPVRPMQITLGRLDSLRILEALVDRPERPRSQLLDSIESLRLKFEQARAARDRLAEGAEQAMARGHWTTGLFDMERAVAGLNPNDEVEREEALRLEQRLTSARRKKRELEATVRRNVELGNHYGTLQDNATSTFEQRITALTERRDCLQFLAGHLPDERAQLYASDLREVDLQIALEQAAFAETEFDGTEEPSERLRLAHNTLARLENTLRTAQFGDEPPGRLLRLLEHWRTVVAQCQRDDERLQTERRLRTRSRRRLLAASALSLMVALVAVGWAAGPWLWNVVSAATRKPTTTEAALADWQAQLAQTASLPPTIAAAFDRLRAALDAAATPPLPDVASWHVEFATALTALARDPDLRELQPLVAEGWRIGLLLAGAGLDQAEAAELRRLTADLATRMQPHGIPTPLDALRR